MRFPNKAGNHADTDDILVAELEAAGIEVFRLEALRDSRTTEVATAVRGGLHGWSFERAWYYWVAKGPGIPIDDALDLDMRHGRVARANGDCGCRGPLFWNHGLATGFYHVDSQEGLNALADKIREIVARSSRAMALLEKIK